MKSEPTFQALINRIDELEKENRQLKLLLSKAGISYAEPENNVVVKNNTIKEFDVTKDVANRFFSYFWGRQDVFAKRFVSRKTGRSGYYFQCDNSFVYGVCPKKMGLSINCNNCKNRSYKQLQAKDIIDHLKGEKADGTDVIGVYPLFADNTCRFIAFDFDDHDQKTENNAGWKEEIDVIREICKLNDIPCLAERSRSGNGGHVWFFFDSPIEARIARKFGFALLDKGIESVNMKSFAYYDRIIPAQDYLPEGGLGNLIALPLQGQALKKGNSAFIDEDGNAYYDQLNALYSIRKISKERIEKFIEEWGIDTNEAAVLPEDDEKPWKRNKTFDKEDVDGDLDITLADKIYIRKDNLKIRMQNQIRRMTAYLNPEYFKKINIGLSVYNIPRYVYHGEDDDNYICIPRGLLDELKYRCDVADVSYKISDERNNGRSIKTEFNGQLRDYQIDGVDEILKHDNGILKAETAYGKTVACCKIIAERKVSTLIVLERSTLISQWEKTLNDFLVFDEELPEYETKSGRIRKRKSIIGVIQSPKDTSNGIVDIAMAGSLGKDDKLSAKLKGYGMIILDECHHAASETISNILNMTQAKYVYGVTATSKRYDGHERSNYMLIGPIRYKYVNEKADFERILVPRFTSVVYPHGKNDIKNHEALILIQNDDERNDLIVEDVRNCIKTSSSLLILTKYTDHADLLYEKLKDAADNVFLMHGKLKNKELKESRERLKNVPVEESVLIIATGKLVGEGFDYPRLDTLFLVGPVSFENLTIQYSGRLNRKYEGKDTVTVYDYIDWHIPYFDKMYLKRLKTYKNLGFKVIRNDNDRNGETGSIFDFETYIPAYEQDLRSANQEIVISSPTLGKNKVIKLIALLRERQNNGVKVTIVTWHPDAYRYGKDEHRIELMEMLRDAGFHIELTEDTCEHYAVIDNEIVWYGSMNLLSKDDIEDNIIRLTDRNIAKELLSKTFGKDNQNKEYSLPVFDFDQEN